MAFQNGFDYHNFGSEISNGNILLHTVQFLIKIGPIAPEITRAKTTPFWTGWQKMAFYAKYLSKW